MKLLTENYNYKKHGPLRQDRDAFGNKVVPEKGFRLLKNEVIQYGDKYFDIYAGWTSGQEAFEVENKWFSNKHGRCTSWERKL